MDAKRKSCFLSRSLRATATGGLWEKQLSVRTSKGLEPRTTDDDIILLQVLAFSDFLAPPAAAEALQCIERLSGVSGLPWGGYVQVCTGCHCLPRAAWRHFLTRCHACHALELLTGTCRTSLSGAVLSRLSKAPLPGSLAVQG